jgi:hypothetical protein
MKSNNEANQGRGVPRPIAPKRLLRQTIDIIQIKKSGMRHIGANGFLLKRSE